jgi:MFS family permease
MPAVICYMFDIMRNKYLFTPGNIVDRFGRKLAVIINAVIFSIGSIIMASSVSFTMLVWTDYYVLKVLEN